MLSIYAGGVKAYYQRELQVTLAIRNLQENRKKLMETESACNYFYIWDTRNKLIKYNHFLLLLFLTKLQQTIKGYLLVETPPQRHLLNCSTCVNPFYFGCLSGRMWLTLKCTLGLFCELCF